MSDVKTFPRRWIVSTYVTALSIPRLVDAVVGWAHAGSARSISFATVHTLVEAHDSPSVAQALATADLVVSDGMPLVWSLRAMGLSEAERVYGPDSFLAVCQRAEQENLPIALYGGTPESIEKLQDFLRKKFPQLKIAAAISPPFRALSSEEVAHYNDELNQSGARIIFAGIGTPKQDLWVAEQKKHLSAVLMAVGAAFDFHAGVVRQAPRWMGTRGLEWLFRLTQDPGRLWRRYLIKSPRFVGLLLWQIIRGSAPRDSR